MVEEHGSDSLGITLLMEQAVAAKAKEVVPKRGCSKTPAPFVAKAMAKKVAEKGNPFIESGKPTQNGRLQLNYSMNFGVFPSGVKAGIRKLLYASLRVYQSVCSRYGLLMRINSLSFNHHQIAAPLEDRLDWRLRQELGWRNCQIMAHLDLPEATIRRWLRHYSTHIIRHNNNHLSLNQVHIMDCVQDMNKLPVKKRGSILASLTSDHVIRSWQIRSSNC